MIFQGFNLLDSRTVAGNVGLPLEVMDVGRRERNARVAELLELAGGVNLGRGSTTDYYHVSLEWVLEQDPDLLLCLFDTGPRQPLELFAGQTGWKALSAVRDGRVYTVPDLSTVSRPGPRVLEAIEELRQCIEDPGR